MSLDQFLVCEKNKIIENIIAYCVKEYVKSSYPPTFDTSAAKRPTMGQSNQECKETSQSNV